MDSGMFGYLLCGFSDGDCGVKWYGAGRSGQGRGG